MILRCWSISMERGDLCSLFLPECTLVASQVELVPANAGAIKIGVPSLGREDPLEEGMAFLSEESHRQRSLADYSP